MLPREASGPQRPNLQPSLVETGLVAVPSMANQDSQAPRWKLRPRQRCLSKSAQAVSCYYRRKSEFPQDTGPGHGPKSRSFLSEEGELWKVFLRRPGCPQFHTRATSTSTCATSPEAVCLGSEPWKAAKDSLTSQPCLDVKVDGSLLPFSKSTSECNYFWKESESRMLSPVTSSQVLGQSHLRKRVPWYILVIHEKDQCLSMLGEEVQRLSKLEMQVQKKDEEILALQEEREALKKQLKSLLKSKEQEQLSECTLKPPGRLSVPDTFGREEEEELRWRQMQEEYVMVNKARELEALSEEEGLEGEAERAADEGATDTADSGVAAQEEGGKKEGREVEEEKEVLEEDEEGSRRVGFLDDTFEEELMSQLEECERVIQHFQLELEVVRTRHSLAIGACISLQRQVDYQQSQLQKVHTENELLQKELRERKRQLQAMTDKFSSLREEKKQEEVKGLTETDNLLLRQQVWELKQELEKQEHNVSEARAEVSELQAQVSQGQGHLQRWRQLRDDVQNKAETAQEAERQARVVLESTQARLEKLRNKIIQAAFSTSGTRSWATEISDSDILEALQRITSERADYYNQLKQKGVKVPPLQQLELSSSPSKYKKLASK